MTNPDEKISNSKTEIFSQSNISQTGHDIRKIETDKKEVNEHQGSVRQNSDLDIQEKQEKQKSDKKLIIATPSAKINVPLEKAEMTGKAMMGEIRETVLKFIPYWKYTYSIQVDRKFENERIEISESGAGYINAINGDEDGMEFGEVQNQTEIPDIRYEQRQPKVTKEEVKEKLIEKIIKKHAREIKSNIVNAQVVMSQNKTFRPSESDITVKFQQVYAPIWEIKGKRKSVEINAYTGRPLETPADDGVEFI